MALSNELISQFVKATKDEQQTKNESTAYGKIVKQGDTEYVQLDGSDLLTPISSTTVVNDGDRVMVTIKNHTAIVTGDLTNPSANNKDVKEIGNKISEFEIVIADKVTTEQLEAEIAKIDKLIADDISAVNAKFETIEGKVAEIDTIKTDVLEVEQKVTAHEGEFTTIRGDIADFKNLTTEQIEAIDGDFHTLESDYADFKETTTNKITANEGNIANLEADQASFKTATAKNFEATNADINSLEADHASFKEATTDKLTANEGSIKELQTNKLDAESAKVLYANIDFSNIKEAAIEKLFTDSGIIKDLIMKDGAVTGELVGVTIKGDLIEGNTLKADKLVILGEDGLYYKLNVDALGETTASSDDKYQNGLDGSVIIAKSITADRVAVTDLVAFGATIGGFNISNNAIYSGTKATVNNTLAGIYQDKDGQFAVGDAVNFVKFYKDQNGQYKLEISADSISFGSEKKTVESLYEAITTNSEDLTAYIESTNKELDNLQGQIDGSIMTWFYEYVPTNNNLPASGWTTTDLKNNHLGDLFYDTITGYCYRWQVQNNQYSWNRITDVDVTKALADAKNAQDTADNKRRVFVSTPTTPYDVGDLWTQGTNGDLMRCQTAKTKAQSYSSSDWVKATKYTDDTAVNALGTRVTTAETQIAQNKNAIDLRATKTEVTEQIDNLKIGGRNLLLNSKDGYAYTASDHSASSTMNDKTVTTVTTANGNRYCWITNNISIPLTDFTKVGESITFSVDVKVTGSFTNLYFGIDARHRSSGSKWFDAIATVPNTCEKDTWFRVSKTATINDLTANDPDGVLFRVNWSSSTVGSTVEYKLPKLEWGNMDTNWTPAPEDIENTLTENYYTKTQTDAKIKVESDRITSTVTKVETVEKKADDAQADIDNLELGGRNYILNSDDFSNLPVSTAAGITTSKEEGVLKIVSTAGNSNWNSFTPDTTIEKNFKTGDEFTFSIEIKCDEGSTGKPTIYFKKGLGYKSMTGSVSTEYSTLYYTGTWIDEETIQFHFGWQNAVGTFYIRKMKFERGNRPTDWSPAPEDADNSITGVENAFETRLGEINTSLETAQSTIDQLSNMISNLVTDANGGSLMTQTGDGWTFNMSSITGNLDAIKDAMKDVNDGQKDTNDALTKLTDLVNSVANKTAYITIATDDNNDPCIELGKTDNLFKVRITNTAIDFLEGSTKIAYANNNTFYSQKIITNELQVGEGPGFAWRTRENGNMGLVYISN